jgi:hypothetical protein
MRRLVTPVRIELLGAGLPATALPVGDGGSPEPAVLYFGIIDFLQVCCVGSRMDRWMRLVFGTVECEDIAVYFGVCRIWVGGSVIEVIRLLHISLDRGFNSQTGTILWR